MQGHGRLGETSPGKVKRENLGGESRSHYAGFAAACAENGSEQATREGKATPSSHNARMSAMKKKGRRRERQAEPEMP